MLTRKRAREGKRVAQVGGTGARETLGRVRIPVHQRQRDDLSLIRRELLHPEGLHRRELSVDLHLRELTDGEVQVADLVRDQQHSLDYGRQIEETHLCPNSETGCFWWVDRLRWALRR